MMRFVILIIALAMGVECGTPCCCGTGSFAPPNNTEAGCASAVDRGGKDFWGYDPRWSLQACAQGYDCLALRCAATGTVQGVM